MRTITVAFNPVTDGNPRPQISPNYYPSSQGVELIYRGMQLTLFPSELAQGLNCVKLVITQSLLIPQQSIYVMHFLVTQSLNHFAII